MNNLLGRKKLEVSHAIVYCLLGFLFFMFVPEVAAQNLTITDPTEFGSKIKESAASGSDIVRYCIGTGLMVGLLLVVYNVATKSPNAKEWIIGYVIAVIVAMIGMGVVNQS